MNSNKIPYLTILSLTIAAAFGKAGEAIEGAALGVLTWVSSDDSVATINVNADGSVYLVPTGKVGAVTVTVLGDSDPNTPQTFDGSQTFEFLPEEVATVSIGFKVVTPEVSSVTVDGTPVAADAATPA